MRVDLNSHGGHNHQQGEGTIGTHHRNDACESNRIGGDIEAHVVGTDLNKG